MRMKLLWDGITSCPKALTIGHQWKLYTGLQQCFEYCIYCDEKRPYVEPLVQEAAKPDFKTQSDATSKTKMEGWTI